MSVINKMLRDLDARRLAVPGIPADSVVRIAASRWQTKPDLPQLQRSSKWYWIFGIALIALAATAGHLSSYWLVRQQDSAMPVAKVLEVPVAPAAAESEVPDALVAETPLPAVTPITQSIASPAAAPMPAAVPAVVPAVAVATTPAPVPTPTPTLIKPLSPVLPSQPVVKAEPPKPAPVTLPLAPAAPPPPTLNTAPKVIPPPVAAPQPNRLSITQETLAQAQGLWNTGAREAALDLMREAVAVTERAYNSGALPADSPVLASLVRELSRMELADGRPARVLDLLIRLEPALQKQADLWAVRGNAAQRLARHQESLMAYNHALAIRPDEPRWMLACAVSLAALGRFEESAEQAEKANVSGIVSPEILLYLKQVGVPVKPK